MLSRIPYFRLTCCQRGATARFRDRRAEAAHGEHEKRIGQRDASWADWYAAYMVAEQSGKEPPQ
jgi:hypothetical protein